MGAALLSLPPRRRTSKEVVVSCMFDKANSGLSEEHCESNELISPLCSQH